MDYTSLSEEAVLKRLKKTLNEHRFLHSTGCAKCAVELAQKFNLDEKKAYTAGLLHDCAKNFEIDEMFNIIRLHIPDIGDCELENHKTLHAPVSAYIAQKDFGVEDGEILSAIRWHTLGKIDMTKFEKIIFLADKIEPHTRDLDYRKLILEHLDEENGIDKALSVCYEKTIESLIARHMKICQTTLEIYEKLKG